MSPPNFRINQPTGAGTGTLNMARPYGLWVDQELELVTTEIGPYLWEIEEAPPGSSAALTQADEATALLTPDVTGKPWRIRLTVGSGVLARTRVFVLGASKDNTGVTVNRGWMQPAVQEQVGEDNASSTGGARGYAPRVETILDDILAEISETGPSGNTVIYRPDMPSPPAGVYLTMAEAVTAAQAMNGVAFIFIDPSDGVPEFTATYNLERRIAVVAFGGAGTDVPVDVTVGASAVFSNAFLMQGINFDGNIAAPLFTVTTGVQDLQFLNCSHDGVGDAANMVTLGTGENRIRFSQCDFQQDSTSVASTASGKNLTALVQGFSYLNGECFGGSAGTLHLQIEGGSTVDPQGSFSGTLDLQEGVLVALSQAQSSVDVNSQRVTNLASPTDSTDADTQGARDTAIAAAALRVFRAAGVSGSVQNDTTAWVTVGVVYLSTSAFADPPGLTKAYTLHADLEVVEASAGTVTAEVRLLDASATSLGTAASTLGGASTFPEHRSTSLTAGNSNGQVRPAATAYLVQLRRQGGSSGDIATCHSAYLEITWS